MIIGKALFIAPRGRTFEEFKQESLGHGWPSFRDEEVGGVALSVVQCGEVLRRGMERRGVAWREVEWRGGRVEEE